MPNSFLDPAQYVFNPFAIPTFLTFLAIVVLGSVTLYREHGSRVSSLFGLVTLSISCWLLSISVLLFTTSEQVASTWVRIEHIGVFIIPAAVYHFAVAVMGIEQRRQWLVWFGWIAAAGFIAGDLLTDRLVGPVYHYWWGYYPRYGWANVPFLAFFFVMLLLALRHYWVAYRNAVPGSNHWHRARLLMIAFGIGYLGSVDYVAAYAIPLYPFGYIPILVFTGLAAYVIARYRLVDITPAFAAGQIFETMTDALLVLDPERVIRLANHASAQMFGVSDRVIIGLPLTNLGVDLLPEEQSRQLLQAGALNYELEYIGQSERPSRRTLSLSASALRDANGQLQAVVCVLRDITERKQAEQDLQDREQRLRLLLQQMPVTLVAMDASMRFTSVTGAGVSSEAVRSAYVGKTLQEVFHTNDPDFPAIGARRRALQGESVTHEMEWDGRHYQAHLEPLHDAGGRIVGSLGVSIDVTAYKHAEAKIRYEAARAAALARVAARLNTQLDLDATLSTVCEESARALQVPVSVIWLYDDERKAYSLAADYGVAPELRSRIQAMPVAVDQDGPRQPAAVLAIPERPNAALEAVLGLRTTVGVNLQREDKPVGRLLIGMPESQRTFAAEELALLRAIADQAALAIVNARLFEQTQRRLRNVQALHTIDTAITSSFDRHQVLDVILRHVIAQLGVDAADILLLNPRDQTLEYTAGQGFHNPAIQLARQRSNEGETGRAVRERRIIIIPNLRATRNARARTGLLTDEGFVWYCAIPLMAKSMVKGALEIFHTSPVASNAEWLSLLETLAGHAAIAIDNAELFEGLQKSNAELALAYDTTLEGWSRALDLRDKETEGHTQRVTALTTQLARQVGVSEGDVIQIQRGALLHDIGKMGIPDHILLKPGPLTDDEWTIMRQHPTYAYQLLSPINYLWPALDIPYCHHEKWDGSGYPRRLAGGQIPLAARLFAVVDVWDALRSDRPYRKSWTKDKVLEYIRGQAGSHFDTTMAAAFLASQLPD